MSYFTLIGTEIVLRKRSHVIIKKPRLRRYSNSRLLPFHRHFPRTFYSLFFTLLQQRALNLKCREKKSNSITGRSASYSRQISSSRRRDSRLQIVLPRSQALLFALGRQDVPAHPLGPRSPSSSCRARTFACPVA